METIVTEKFAIQLTLEHPEIYADVITEKLGIKPNRKQLPAEGSGGKSRAGRSFWRTEHVFEGNRYFFEEVEDLVTVLAQKRAFITEFNKKGTVTVTIQLAGQVNIGDVAKPELLQQMAALGICLGLEVFPIFG